MKKKIFIILSAVFAFAAALMLTSCSQPADNLSDNKSTLYPLTYETFDGDIIIIDCDTEYSGAVTVPAEINGIPVTSIGAEAFALCTEIDSITLPDTVRVIGARAFYGCTSLSNINLSANLLLIEIEAFADCVSLAHINLPAGLGTIESCAFYNCTSLSDIALPDGIIHISDRLFSMCSGLSHIWLPASIYSISNTAFEGCTSFIIYCPPDSYAWIYCEENNIPHAEA